MRFSIDHADITPAFTFVSRIAPSRAVRPVLSSVLLEARGQHLTLTTTDLETSAVTTVPANVLEEGRAALPVRYVGELLRRIPAGQLEWSGDDDAGATVTWKRSRFSIHGFDANSFPSVPEFPSPPSHTLAQGILRRTILHSVFAAGTGDMSRPLLSGVELRMSDDGIFALATDGFQAASFSSNVEASRPQADGVVVPATALSEVARLLGDGEEPCAIASQGNQILFRAGNSYLSSRVLEGRFFSVLDLVPKQFSSSVQVDREAFVGACSRVAFVSEHEPPHTVLLKAGDGEVRLEASNPQVGSAQESVEAQQDGEPIELGFNGHQLLEGLRHFAGPRVLLELSGVKSLARITDPEDRRLQLLQMPLDLAGND